MHKMEESKFFTFSLKLSYHKVYFSATWCKRSLLYDQTIEDINIFSPAFLVDLRGVAQMTWWLKLPHSPLLLLIITSKIFRLTLNPFCDKTLHIFMAALFGG